MNAKDKKICEEFADAIQYSGVVKKKLHGKAARLNGKSYKIGCNIKNEISFTRIES